MCSVLPASRRIGRRNAFELITEERVYNLFADDAETMNEWITCIKKIISSSGDANQSVVVGDVTVIRVKGMMCDRCVLQVRKVVYNVTVCNSTHDII